MAYDGSLKFDTSLDASGLQKGANNLKGIVEGLGIFELLKKGVQMVKDSVQAAMSRLDTMIRPRYDDHNGAKATNMQVSGQICACLGSADIREFCMHNEIPPVYPGGFWLICACSLKKQ